MIKIGTARHDETVDLGSGWTKQPSVMLSPFSLRTYDSDEPNDQFVSLGPTSIYESPVDSTNWFFKADVSLRKEGNQGELSLADSSGNINANTWTSATFTTPADTEEITVSLSASSRRGNGLNWNGRLVNATIEYLDGGSWLAGATSQMIILDLDVHDYTLTQHYPSGAAWQTRVRFDAADYLDSTFGLPSYTYDQETVNIFAPSRSASISVNPSSPNAGGGSLLNFIPGTPAKPGQRYKTEYFFANLAITSTISGGPAGRNMKSEANLLKVTAGGLPQLPTLWGVAGTHNDVVNPLNQTLVNQTFVYEVDEFFQGSLDNRCNITLRIQGFGGVTGSLAYAITGTCTATFHYRVLTPTPNVPLNNFDVDGYEFITVDSILATGIGSWLATDGA